MISFLVVLLRGVDLFNPRSSLILIPRMVKNERVFPIRFCCFCITPPLLYTGCTPVEFLYISIRFEEKKTVVLPT